jgi:hypothetical protein
MGEQDEGWLDGSWQTTEWERLGVDTTRPSVARVYDAVLGR